MLRTVFHVSLFGLSGSFVALIPLLLLPFLTRSLSPEGYGLAVFFSSMVSMLLPVIGFGAINALSVKYFFLDKREFSSYFWSVMSIVAVTAIAIAAVLTVFIDQLADWSGLAWGWILLGVLIATLWTLSQACGIVFIAREEPLNYLVVNMVLGCTVVAVTLILVAKFNMSWTGFAVAFFSGHLVAAVVSLLILKNSYPLATVNYTYLHDSVRFGMPVMVHSLAIGLMSYFDRVIILNYLGASAVAEYAVAFQLAFILSFVAQACSKVFVPWLYSNLRKRSYEVDVRVVRSTYIVYIIIVVVTALFCMSLDVVLPQIAGETYAHVTPVAKLIAIGAGFNAAYLTVVNYIFFAGKTNSLAICSGSVCCLYLVLAFQLIPRFGLTGAAWAFLLANVILFIVIWMAAAKSHKMPWFTPRLLSAT